MLICLSSPGSCYSEIQFFSPLTLTYSICKISLEETSRRNNRTPNSSASTDFYLCALSPSYFESALGLKASDRADSLLLYMWKKGQAALSDLSCRKITGLHVVFLLSYVAGLVHRLNNIRFCASFPFIFRQGYGNVERNC